MILGRKLNFKEKMELRELQHAWMRGEGGATVEKHAGDLCVYMGGYQGYALHYDWESIRKGSIPTQNKLIRHAFSALLNYDNTDN